MTSERGVLFPVYEFRPLPDYFRGGCRRFADGQWIEDDGEYDVAFISNYTPICLYVSLPYQKNLGCSWLTGHWTGSDAAHPRANPWHYALREGETEWGGSWDRDKHQNEIAGRQGMTKLCSEQRCANGGHVEFHAKDPHIAAELLRDRETKEIFRFSDALRCMYCGSAPAFPVCEAVTAPRSTRMIDGA